MRGHLHYNQILKPHKMIDAKELYINAWYNHNGKWNYADHKGPFQWQDRDWYALGESMLFLEDVQPIPLTPELLEKAGFIREKEPFIYHRKPLNFDMDLQVWFAGKPKVLINGTEFPHVQYLHQLQNLFQALTGRELDVKW